jgi:CheY-like chemotaxis protein
LEQVFLNVINNAVDAILEQGNGGTLTVRVLAEGSNVHAVFEDSGPGIKEPNRIFDPFYTTKTVGKGTGLGLSICYGIIKEHGGDISAHNRPEGGAIVDVKLPAAERAPVVEEAAVPPKREFALEGRVLLVEEEEAVLEFERDVLTGAGARVTAVTKRSDAEGRLRSEEFDAVIADGKMPGGWTAPEIHRWLAENRPGLERHLMITFSSVAEPETRKFLQDNNVPSLAKPFEVADLIAQARKLLQKTKAAGAD